MTTRRFIVTLVTNASGDATGYTPYLSGKLNSIQYVKTDYTDGVDFTITSDVTGETLWTESNVNAAKVCRPRGATHSNVGVAALYAAAGTAVNDKITLSHDRVKIVVGSGGDTHTGVFHVVIED